MNPIRFCLVEYVGKTGEIFRAASDAIDPRLARSRIDLASFGGLLLGVKGEFIPWTWFVRGAQLRRGLPFMARCAVKACKLRGRAMAYRNLDVLSSFDVVLVMHDLYGHWEMLDFLRQAKGAFPQTIFLASHGHYNLGRVREFWRDPAWYRSFCAFADLSDLFLTVNEAAVPYLQAATKTPVAYFPPAYPLHLTQGHFRTWDEKEDLIWISGNTQRLDIVAALHVARILQRQHPELLIRLTDWGKMNLEPLAGCRYEVVPRVSWFDHIQQTSRARLIINLDAWWTNGRAAWDAAAVGTPSIGINSDGQMQLFPELTVPDVAGFSQALDRGERLLTEPVFYRQIQEKALSRLKEWSYEKSAIRFKELLQNLPAVSGRSVIPAQAGIGREDVLKGALKVSS